MSASAGRVLLMPQGTFDASATYYIMDCVSYNGSAYVAKQTTTGNLPTNTTYWEVLVEGGAGAGSLAELSDVALQSPQNGDALMFNGTNQKWTNNTVQSISITSPPNKTSYIVGDSLDLTGMVVSAIYLSGQTIDITHACTFTPPDNTILDTSNTSVTATFGNLTATQAITVTAPVFGVEWDGSSSPAWTRTDDAVGFADPNPYYAEMTGNPSSPFDDIMPWAGIVVEERTGGTMVKIPKFWYKLTQNGEGLKIQISFTEREGFGVSPAHRPRGRETEDRDYVYVGRYHCASDYKSKTGVKPLASTTLSDFRTNIHALGTGIYQWDFQMLFTIWLLYLVEFANWNSQDMIGAGKSSSNFNMGYTDSMPYHTGTMANSRTFTGNGTQYRNIEGLWENMSDFLDGCYYNTGRSLHIEMVAPNQYQDATSGDTVGNVQNSSNFPLKMSVSPSSFTFFDMFYPSTGGGSNSTYTCDYWKAESTNDKSLYQGFSSTTFEYNRGLFSIRPLDVGSNNSTVTSRIQELP